MLLNVWQMTVAKEGAQRWHLSASPAVRLAVLANAARLRVDRVATAATTLENQTLQM
jgi:hypothetical protein